MSGKVQLLTCANRTRSMADILCYSPSTHPNTQVVNLVAGLTKSSTVTP